MAARTVSVELVGEGFKGSLVKPDAQASLVRTIHEALRNAARYRTLRATHIMGRPFRFLSRIWDIDQAPWQETQSGTLLLFQAPTLASAAPGLFDQGTLFEEDRVDPEWTAFDLLGQVVDLVQREKADESTMDLGMLSSLTSFESSLRRNLESAEFSFEGPSRGRAHIDSPLVAKSKEALMATPPARTVRVAGRLDMLRMSDHLFQLVVSGGVRLRGVWAAENMPLRELLGEDVLMEGKAHFRPSGEVSVLEASAVRLASSQDDLYRKLPKGGSKHLQLLTSSQRSGSFRSIVGKWPGDESEEEVRAWLEELS